MKRSLFIVLLAVAACIEPTSESQVGYVSQQLTGGSGGTGGAAGCGELCADKITQPSEHATAQWVYEPTTFSFNGHPDNTLAIGWNADNADPTEPRWYMLFEQDYLIDPSVPRHLMEWHLQGWAPGSIIRRPLTVTMDRGTWDLDVGIRGQFHVSDSTSAKMRWLLDDAAAGTASLHLFDVQMQWETNNAPMLRGLNFGSTGYVEAVRINSLDEVHIAAAGGGTRVAGPLTVAPAGTPRITATTAGVELRGTVAANPTGAAKMLEVNATGIGLHGKAPQPQCNISDSNTNTLVAELLQCLHDRGDVNWAGAQ